MINHSAGLIEKPDFHRFEIMVDDQQVRTLPFRLVQATHERPPTMV